MLRCWLIRLAWLNAGLHFVALLLTYVAIRPGSTQVGFHERVAYLAAAPVGWTLAWSCWMLCVVGLIAFLTLLVSKIGARPSTLLPLMLAVVGAGFDLFCDAVYILVLPQLVWERNAPLFFLVERITGIGSLVMANGCYSIAVLLLSLPIGGGQFGGGVLGRLTRLTGYLVGLFGLLASAAGFADLPWLALWTTPPTIILFCLWVVLVAHAVGPDRSVP